jgi:polyphosphate kinase
MMTDNNIPISPLKPPADRFINRELSWLEFNDRVLQEARNMANPLLERLRFLSISASNLDEFFMIRVAGLQHQLRHKKTVLSQDGMLPRAQLKHIIKRVTTLTRDQYHCWQCIINDLRSEGIIIETASSLSSTDREWLADYVNTHLPPLLGSYMLEPAHSFPLLPNLGLAAIAAVERGEGGLTHSIIPLPPTLDRFIRLPSCGKQLRFINLEIVLELFKSRIFLLADPAIKELGFIRITRDSELDISDEAEDLVTHFERAVEKRKRGSIVRIEITRHMSNELRAVIARAFNAEKSTFMETEDSPGLAAIAMLYNVIIRNDLKFPPFHARFPERVNAFGGDCFAAIAAKDMIIHHPYESFDVVVKFLRQAAADPNVVSIKQTLYRTSNDSEIIKALIEAAGAGKSVTAIVELKARFDEEANLRWARTLKKAGATVIFGVAGLKIHAKVSLVVRREGKQLRSYVHFGTGNYHPITARTYVDLSFFTCDPALCEDANRIFEYLTTGVSPVQLAKLAASPFTLRTRILTLIEAEIAHAKAGRPATIWAKLNSLVDREVIDALYHASQQGVHITLIVRGICTLRPGIAGLSDNITVKSIVGRFLEHARIFCFGAGNPLPSPQAKLFISSADWMYRSFNRRVEAMIPIENPTVHAQVLDQIMVSNINDEKQSWYLCADGTYKRLSYEGFSAQEYFMINRSLSGMSTPRHSHIAPDSIQAPHRSIGVIDIGSNSVRLVVYDGLKRVPMPLFNEKLLCGLARGLGQTHRLSVEGMALAHNALARFIHLARIMRVGELHIFATAAVRDASDGKEFVTQIEARHGITIRTLTGEEEATFGAYGILSSMPDAKGIIGDLGGGSLELSYLQGSSVSHVHSFPIGLLRLVSNDDRNATIAIIDNYLAQFPIDQIAPGTDFYAVGGGFRNLAKIYIALTHYSLRILHHYSVPATKFLSVLRNIAKIPPQALQEMSGVSGKRADTLPYTALILERIITRFKPANIIFSAYGVREGFLYAALADSEKSKDPLLAGCGDIISQLSELPDYGYELAEWMNPLFEYESPTTKRLRVAACILSSLARYEHTEYRAEIAYRRFLDSSITGIDHPSRLFIACALFHRYKTNTDATIMEAAMAILDDDTMVTARIIGLTMRLGHNISASVPGIINKTRLVLTKQNLTLHFEQEVADLMGEAVKKRLDKLAEILRVTPEIQIGK